MVCCPQSACHWHHQLGRPMKGTFESSSTNTMTGVSELLAHRVQLNVVRLPLSSNSNSAIPMIMPFTWTPGVLDGHIPLESHTLIGTYHALPVPMACHDHDPEDEYYHHHDGGHHPS